MADGAFVWGAPPEPVVRPGSTLGEVGRRALHVMAETIEADDGRTGAYLRVRDTVAGHLERAMRRHGLVALPRAGLTQRDLDVLYKALFRHNLLTLDADVVEGTGRAGRGREWQGPRTVDEWLFGRSEHVFTEVAGADAVPRPYNFSVPFYTDAIGVEYVWTTSAPHAVDPREDYTFVFFVNLPAHKLRPRIDAGLLGGEMPFSGEGGRILTLNTSVYAGPAPPPGGVTVVSFEFHGDARNTGVVTVAGSGWR